ncbi:MAG: S41 family peptidase, partial [Candidatus Peregrinibacteria bacterium]
SIERNGHNLEFEVKRDFILYSSVQYQILQTNSGKNIGYIELWIFDENSTEEFTKAAEALVAEDVDGILIDLRNNPGGFMEDAINIISLFTATEKTATQLLFSDGSKEKFKTTGNGPLAEYETVVLINEGSASASEILAGALKDYGTAKLVGTTSFGKGTVQQLSEYRDGSIFKYTISKWLTPNGTDINKEGIKPDIKVTNTGSTDTQLKKALEQF